MATKGKGKAAFITTINNQNLRDQLLRWIDLAKAALDLPNPSSERTNAIYTFVRTFVPPDVTEDDIDHFSNSLAADEEFFESLHRELTQCESGYLVEKIEGDQTRKAVFTILPAAGTLSENSSLDIVREVAFISGDGGVTWTAESSSMTKTILNVASVGCCHGELDKIYSKIAQMEATKNMKIDLLLICGDFQGVSNSADLNCVAMPPKYRHLNTFHHYVSGVNVAPVMTIFIGGNHEASNILQDLYYGGYAAPNIYFLGFGGIVWYKGLRIGGLSGIFNERHYRLGRYEYPPYTPDSIRSIYHVRELEVFRMAHIQDKITVFLTHDWPNRIWEYGDKQRLLKVKPYFREDIDSNQLGSPPAMHLLKLLKPNFWFSGHMHVKFDATVPHETPELHQQLQQQKQIVETASTTTSSRSSAQVEDGSAESELEQAKKRLCRQVDNNEELDIDDVDGGDDGGDGYDGAEQQSAVNEESENKNKNISNSNVTRFTALDKVLPGRQFLEVFSVPITAPTVNSPPVFTDNVNENCRNIGDIQLDLEWMAVVRRTHQYVQPNRGVVKLPAMVEPVTAEELEATREMLAAEYGPNLVVPALPPLCIQTNTTAGGGGSGGGGFVPGGGHQGGRHSDGRQGGRGGGRGGGGYYQAQQLQQQQQPQHGQQAQAQRQNFNQQAQQEGNAQTDKLLKALGLEHRWTKPFGVQQIMQVQPPLPPGPPPATAAVSATVRLQAALGLSPTRDCAATTLAASTIAAEVTVKAEDPNALDI